MSKYKRMYLPGNSYFFTVVTENRINLFSEQESIQLLRAAFRYVQLRKPFKIEAICVLPDHIHCIWVMEKDVNYSMRWQMIKTYFTRQYRYQNPDLKQKKLWQSRFWEHVIRDQDDWRRHIDYIHYNPVKHDLVESAKDWRYSSFCKFYEQGYYESGWGDSEPDLIRGLNCEECRQRYRL